MFARSIVTVGAIVMFAVTTAAAGENTRELATNFINAKMIFPVNGLEYEHVFPNAFAVAVEGSYLPASDVTYKTIGVGLKKYFGDHRVFYVAAYPQFLRFSGTFTEVGAGFPFSYYEYKASGSVSTSMLMAAVGWRGIWGHFTLGGELGGGSLGKSKFDVTGYDPELDRNVTTQEKLWVGTAIVPLLQLYLGYAF